MSTPLDKLGPYWVKKLIGEVPPIPYRLLIFNDVGQVNAESPIGGTSQNATGNLNQIQEFYNGGAEIGGIFGPAWGIVFPYGWYKCVSTTCSLSTVGPTPMFLDSFISPDGTDPTMRTIEVAPAVPGLNQWRTTLADPEQAGYIRYKALFGPASAANLDVDLVAYGSSGAPAFVTSFPYFVTMTATNNETTGADTSYVAFGLTGPTASRTDLIIASDGMGNIDQIGETGNNAMPRFELTPGVHKLGIYVTATSSVAIVDGVQVGLGGNIGSIANMNQAYIKITNPNDEKNIDSVGIYTGLTLQQALLATM